MAVNDIIVLDSILEQKKKQVASMLSDSDYFEVFTFEQILKNYDLSYDELLSGKTGGSDDGGIDGFFFFINDELIDEDTDLEIFKKNPIMEIFLIQAKQSASFSESSIEHVIATAEDIFNLEKNVNELRKYYNTALIDKVDIFRKAYIGLAARHPELRVYYVYASKGDTEDIHPKVSNKAENLNTIICKKFTGATARTEFKGARELLDSSRLEKSYTLQLRFLENYISRGEDNYIILSSLKDYYEFVIDGKGNLRRYIFESNVRDYQGDVEVNNDIRQTLESDDDLDFWWLNNGITIISSKASIAGKTITLDDVQVVNGLQTTTTIYNHLKRKDLEDEDDNRSILIRIIVITDSEARDRIIKATNYQTPIPVASLRATDRIQRDIEDYFMRHDWFYDRRKNYYKNLGKPVDRIISIPYLAQAVMAIILREPDNSRARPSSLIKRDEDYKRVFSASLPFDIYLFCAKTMKIMDTFIRSTSSEYTWQERSNLRFHLAMLVIIKLLKRKDYGSTEIQSLLSIEFNQEILAQSLSELMSLTYEYAESLETPSIDRIAKSREFVTYVLDSVTGLS